MTRLTIQTAVHSREGAFGAGSEPKVGAAASSPLAATSDDRSDRLALILGSLEDDKAEDILTIDLRGKSALADHMVIASGRSNRHVASIGDKLIERLKDAGFGTARSEGVSNGDWALIDASDVIVHVFRPEVRSFYALEKMWAPAEVLAAREARQAAAEAPAGGPLEDAVEG